MPMWFSFFWWNGFYCKAGNAKARIQMRAFFVSEHSRNVRVCCKGLDGTNGG